MKTFRTLSVIILLSTFLVAESAFAQMRPRRPNFGKKARYQQMAPKEMLGIRLGNNFEHENYLVGAQLVLPAGLFWRFVPSVDYHFVESNLELDRWQFNGDLVFQPRPKGLFYFGGGLAVNYLLPDEGDSTTRKLGQLRRASSMARGQRSPGLMSNSSIQISAPASLKSLASFSANS